MSENTTNPVQETLVDTKYGAIPRSNRVINFTDEQMAEIVNRFKQREKSLPKDTLHSFVAQQEAISNIIREEIATMNQTGELDVDTATENVTEKIGDLMTEQTLNYMYIPEHDQPLPTITVTTYPNSDTINWHDMGYVTTDPTEPAEPTIVEEFEEKYENMSDALRDLMLENYELMAGKTLDYGLGNVLHGGNIENEADRKFMLMGIYFRMDDKIQRIKNILFNDIDVTNESLMDSFKDIANFGLIAELVERGAWKL